MFNALSLDDFLLLAKQHPRIAIYKEILGDTLTPVQAFQALQPHMKGATLLESSPKEKTSGRYSFLGFTPKAELCIQGEQNSDPFTRVREFYAQMHAHTSHALSGFAGGIVGFVTYDAVRLFEPALKNKTADQNFPDLLFKSYQDHIVFDLQTGAVVLSTIVEVGDSPTAVYEQGILRLQKFHHELTHAFLSEEVQMAPVQVSDAIELSLSDAEFIAAGEKAKQFIKAGDAFQIVLSRAFNMTYTAQPFSIYRALRARNPSPYMFYLDHEDLIICGASPEKMISVKDNIVQSCPLAGTRPRGKEYDDNAQAANLLADAKEVAEHMMLVDLARNDIGAVAKPGSVKVSALKQIHHFSHVMHISSTVEAPLAVGKDAFDALCAAFPAGTLSGAPKIRAMQIIDEIEGAPRRLYGGAICFLDSQGNFDSCIAIRMAQLCNGIASVSAGAGIVADSQLQSEADETRHKSKAVLEAIAYAQQGLI